MIMKNFIFSYGSFTTITIKSTNKSYFVKGMFHPYSKEIINKSKKEGFKVIVKGNEIFIYIPIFEN